MVTWCRLGEYYLGGGVIYIRIFLSTLLQAKIKVYKTCVNLNFVAILWQFCGNFSNFSNLQQFAVNI